MRLRRPDYAMLLSASCLWAGAAWGQSATDIGSVSATGTATLPADQGPYAPPKPGSAAASAPSYAPVEAAQPTSIVGQTFLQNSLIPAQNFDEAVEFTPSLANLQPAGPVSQQNYAESIRGFQYSQFNTTFDNLVLPGTTSSFAPQSATYFTTHDLGSITIDRGPGTASTIGYATFGGTLALYSKQPSNTFNAQAYSTFGDYDQKLWGVELDSGALPALNGGRGFIDFSRLQTGAAISGVTTDRDNGFAKWEQPIGGNTLVTLVGMINDSYGHTAYGSTLAQIKDYGPGYGLNNNPGSQDFQGYNTDIYNTDFEYVRVDSTLGYGLNLQETAYTNSYFRRGTEGADPNGLTPNLGETGGSKEYIDGVRQDPTDDVQGTEKHNDFRDWGDTLRFTDDLPWGELRFGVWGDYISNGAYRARVDFTDGYTVYTTKATAPQLSQRYHDRLVTGEPYIEFAWKPLPGLVITPGVRYTSVTRELDAGILSGTPAGEYNKTWNKAQWSVDAHYSITPAWSAYVQIAKGFLAPPLSTIESTVPATAQPEETVNYQLGTAYQHGRLAISGDVYYIPFQNYIASTTTPDGTLYFNEGGAVYKGVEVEGTYRVIDRLFFYGNGSLNSAVFNNGVSVYQSPQHTAAGGFIYNRDSLFADQDNLYGSILVKEVGKQYGLNGSTAGGKPTVSDPIGAYNTVDAAIGYTFAVQRRKLRVALNLYNLANNRSLIGFAGTDAAGQGLYWTNPGFSSFVSVSAALD
jgi:iron complex outermembrane receptor protein